MALTLDSILGGFKGFFVQAGTYLLYGGIAAGIAYWEYHRRKVKETFKYPVRVFKRRQGSQRPEANFIGGYMKDKAGITFFRVKTGRWPGQHKDFYQLPNPNYMDEDNRVYYEVVDPDNWQQVQRVFVPQEIKLVEIEFIQDFAAYQKGLKAFVREASVTELLSKQIVRYTGESKTISAADIHYKPVSSTEKKVISAELAQAYQLLGISDWKVTAAWVGGAVLILLAGLIAYFFNTE